MTSDPDPFVGPNPDRNLKRSLRIGAFIDRALDCSPELVVEGVLRRSVGLALEAEGCQAFLPGITEGWEALEEVAEVEGLL